MSGLPLVGVAAAVIAGALLLHPDYDTVLDYFGYALRVTAWISFSLFMLAYVARPLVQVTGTGQWLVRNRRYLGLGAALSHTVHFGYVVVFSIALDEPQDAVVIIFGGAAFVFLWLMALTSNDLSVRSLGNSWRILHRAGLHYVWLIFMQTFLGSALVNPMAWPFVGLGLAGLVLRVTAWVQRRRRTG